MIFVVFALLVLLGSPGEADTLVVGLRRRDKAQIDLAALFERRTNPSHDEYLAPTSTSEIAAIVGASADTIRVVTAWAGSLPGCLGPVTLSGTADILYVPHAGPAPTLPRALAAEIDFLLVRGENSAKNKSSRAAPSQLHAGAASPAASRAAFGIPANFVAVNSSVKQMVWGPGTYGVALSDLKLYFDTFNVPLSTDIVSYDTVHHGTPGGDNFGEGTLDTEVITGIAQGISTVVSNTNTSSATEENDGFGYALLDFVTELAARAELPQVLSISLGSLSFESCNLLCKGIEAEGQHTYAECWAYLQTQRQVCMYLNQEQTDRIDAGFQILGLKGVTVLAASGDGGSHFSFEPFGSLSPIGRALNVLSCSLNLPTYPASSPFVLAIGGTSWQAPGSATQPIGWSGSGGGFSWEYAAPNFTSATVAAYLQNAPGLPDPKSFNALGRAYPDLAAVALDVPMCISGSCVSAGGTSASTPAWAGVFSLLTHLRLSNGLPPLGYVVPRVYAVGQQFPGEAFQDIVVGNTKTSCATGFAATAGWDPQTGFGRPLWAGLVEHFST